MAFQIKFRTQIDVSGDSLWLTDLTGQYDSGLNDTGWGDPNPELDESCLLAYVFRRDADGDVPLVPVSYQFLYDSGAANTKETTFQFFFTKDGHHIAHLIRLPVSMNGTETVDGDSLEEGDYFYMGGSIQKIESGVPVVVTDYKEVADDTGVVQTVCQNLWVPQLSMKVDEIYRDYKTNRGAVCIEDESFMEMTMLQQDIDGGYKAFKSGLTVQSEDVIDTLLHEQKLQ